MSVKHIDSLSVGADEFQAWFIVEFADLGGF